MIIKKAKIIKNGCLETTFIDDEGNEVNLKGANPVHSDLKDAMKRLVPFLCDLTEQKEAEKFDWFAPDSEANADLVRRMDVTGVTISGSDSFVSCVLTGRRTLVVTNKVLCLNTPPITLEEEAENYERLSELNEAVDAVIEEAKLYVKEHKYSAVQTTLDFEGTENPFGNEGEAGESDPLDKAS
jgi:hypothetical protein